MKLSQWIKQRRTEEGLSQRELGAKVGVGYSAVSKWERGAVKKIELENFNKLVELFGVDDDVMNLEEFSDQFKEYSNRVDKKDFFEELKIALLDYSLNDGAISYYDLPIEEQSKLVVLAQACMNEYMKANASDD